MVGRDVAEVFIDVEKSEGDVGSSPPRTSSHFMGSRGKIIDKLGFSYIYKLFTFR